MKVPSIQPELGAILLNIKQIGIEITDSDKITTADKMAFDIWLSRIKDALDAMERLNK